MQQGPPTYAELHLHLGGAVLPRILYTFLQRARQDRSRPEMAGIAGGYLRRFSTYERFERRLMRPCDTLNKYLEKHKLVEPLQRIESLPYFVNRMLRGAYVFENVSYLELRYNPYFRLPKGTPDKEVRPQLEAIVQTVAAAAVAAHRQFPIVFTQILCMDSRLSLAVNQAILETALAMPAEVAALDLAGPDDAYAEREEELIGLLRQAKDKGLKLTAHVFETPDGCCPRMLEYLDRIGHGIQIPLRAPRLLPEVARRRQCLEICPTTYFMTGTIRSYSELKPVFGHCFDMGVDIAVCTDNSALNGVRLPLEFERLLTHGVIDFAQMERIREAAFRHAFRWPGVLERRHAVL
jgi:adenosine deaminase